MGPTYFDHIHKYFLNIVVLGNCKYCWVILHVHTLFCCNVQEFSASECGWEDPTCLHNLRWNSHSGSSLHWTTIWRFAKGNKNKYYIYSFWKWNPKKYFLGLPCCDHSCCHERNVHAAVWSSKVLEDGHFGWSSLAWHIRCSSSLGHWQWALCWSGFQCLPAVLQRFELQGDLTVTLCQSLISSFDQFFFSALWARRNWLQFNQGQERAWSSGE